MEITVKDLIDALAKSSGFVIFVSYMEPKPGAPNNIEHRYIRQQFLPEDLKASFDNFTGFLTEDLKNSGQDLVRSAESIANSKIPNIDLQ